MRYLYLLGFLLLITTVNAQSIDEYFTQAKTAFGEQDYEEAILTSNLGILEDSMDVRFYRIIGQSLIELGAFQDAYDTYSYAIYILPDEAGLYSDRGNLLAAVHQFDQALEDHTIAIDKSPNDSVMCYTLNNRATAKMSVRDFLGAYDDLKIAYQLDSLNLAVLNNLGTVCDEVGKGRETLKYLHKVIDLDSTYFPAYVNIGYKYQEMGKYSQAIQYFDQVLAIAPEEPLGYSNRSFNKYKTGDFKGAMLDIERSIELFPANSYAYRIRALIHLEEDRVAEACEDLTTATELGFAEMYGDEVAELQAEHCRKKKKK